MRIQVLIPAFGGEVIGINGNLGQMHLEDLMLNRHSPADLQFGFGNRGKDALFFPSWAVPVRQARGVCVS